MILSGFAELQDVKCKCINAAAAFAAASAAAPSTRRGRLSSGFPLVKK